MAVWVLRQSSGRRATYSLGRMDRTCENVLESELDVAGVQGGRLDERQVVLACGTTVSRALQGTDGGGVGGDYALANCLASSVGTARRCLKSLLLPTSMMTMLESAWSRSSFSHLVTFSYVWCLLMS